MLSGEDGKFTFNLDGEEVEYEITAWSGDILEFVESGIVVVQPYWDSPDRMRLILPAGHPELN